VGLDRDFICGDYASRQYNHFIDRLIEIKTILSRRRFLDVVADPVDDVASSIGIVQNAAERFRDSSSPSPNVRGDGNGAHHSRDRRLLRSEFG
jgi:hypothetical protein